MAEVVQSDRAIDRLLAEYGESHQDLTNKKIHWFAVPTIFWTVVALLWSIPVPEFMAVLPLVNWATIALVGAVIYYFTLSVPLAFGMLLFAIFCMIDVVIFQMLVPVALWKAALGIFVIAWIAQFLWPQDRRKKALIFQGYPVPVDRTCMADVIYLSPVQHRLLRYLGWQKLPTNNI